MNSRIVRYYVINEEILIFGNGVKDKNMLQAVE